MEHTALATNPVKTCLTHDLTSQDPHKVAHQGMYWNLGKVENSSMYMSENYHPPCTSFVPC